MAGAPGAWYPDPTGRFDLRYWDGAHWTEHVARGGVQATDPLAAAYTQPTDPLALRPLGIGEVLDAAIKIFRRRFVPLVKSVAIVTVPLQVLTIAVTLSLPRGTSAQTGTRLWTSVAGAVLVFVVGLVGGLLAEAASLKIISDTYFGTESDWRASLRFGFSRLRSVVWLATVRLVLLFVGFVACIIPGIWLYGQWLVALPALLLEDVHGTKALRRSSELVKGRWWPTAITFFLATLLTQVVVIAGSLVLIPLVAIRGSNDFATLLAQGVVSGALRVLTVPFLAAVVVVMYFDLRVRKEGFDLQLLAQRIGVDASASSGASDMPWSPQHFGGQAPWPPVSSEASEPPPTGTTSSADTPSDLDHPDG
jgi:Protein of unknown function (DUF2510)/Membrane domain of glycerophosphoryl diester phosphodiesterase